MSTHVGVQVAGNEGEVPLPRGVEKVAEPTLPKEPEEVVVWRGRNAGYKSGSGRKVLLQTNDK